MHRGFQHTSRGGSGLTAQAMTAVSTGFIAAGVSAQEGICDGRVVAKDIWIFWPVGVG